MSKKEEWLYSCPSCGFKQSTLTSGAGRGVDGLETLRKQNFKIILQHLEKQFNFKNSKSLEVGCAEGWFLEAMKEKSADIMAVEPSAHALDRQKEGHHVVQGFFPDALPEGSRYDLIVFNDVFEHLPDPVAAIKKCEEHLNDKGLLLINIPNSRGIFYRVACLLKLFGMETPFHRLWQKDLPSPHMTYFSDKNMTEFVTKYTDLKKTRHFYLPSISKNGLEERIQASYQGFSGKIIYTCLKLAFPLFKVLPQDIMVFIFKKP